MTMRFKLFCAAILLIGSPAFAGTSQLVVKDGAGSTQNLNVTTTGGGFFLYQNVLCDATAGATCAAVGANGLRVDLNGSGTLPAFAATPTFNLGTLNGAATAVKQPALGTAGTASADVITVQGIASMTALKVDGSGVTQPVSGTFWQTTQPVSAASLPLPTGAATSANQFNSANTFTTLTPTVTAGAYVSGKSLGGLMTFSAFKNSARGSGIFNGFSVASKTGLTISATVYVFGTTPGTTCTDNTAFALATADQNKLVVPPFIISPSVVGVGAVEATGGYLGPAISVANTDSTTNLYVCVITSGVTPASTSEYSFGMNVLSD